MVSAIIIDNGAQSSEVKRAIQSAEDASIRDVTVITGSSDSHPGSRVVRLRGRTIGAALAEAFASSQGERAIVLDASSNLDAQSLSRFASSTERDGTAMVISGPDFSMPSSEELVEHISRDGNWNITCASLSREFMNSNRQIAGESFSETMGHLYIRALGDHETVTMSDDLCSGSTRGEMLNRDALNRLLRSAVEFCNIEELYPDHAWEQHQTESAAAAYHSLAGMFIRFGDHDSALECLRLGDQLEDSPRSLALKALIAQDRGEMLGAVANMVASLQQYEIRKREDGSHYLSFKPADFEAISSSLQAGLAALNKRDNECALRHFSEAVFNFDTFYSELGLAGSRDAE